VKVMTEAAGEDGCRWFALAHGCDSCVNEWQCEVAAVTGASPSWWLPTMVGHGGG